MKVIGDFFAYILWVTFGIVKLFYCFVNLSRYVQCENTSFSALGDVIGVVQIIFGIK